MRNFSHLRKGLFIALVLLSCLASQQVWSKGAPVTTQYTKDFRNLIIQGTRPEIVACMVAANLYFKKVSDFEEMRWPENTSLLAILNEVEYNHHLVRTINLQGETLLNNRAFFRSWVKVNIECRQEDEGVPQVKVTVDNSR